MNLSFLMELTRRDLTERYTGSILGRFWVFVMPLVNMTIYILIFSKIMGSRLPGSHSMSGYTVYLISGLVPWMAFSSTIQRSSSILSDRRHIITKVKLFLPAFPVHIALSESVTFVASMIVFMTAIPFMEPNFQWKPLLFLLPIIVIVQQLFAYSIGLFFSLFQIFYKDLREVAAIIIQGWFWFTPVVYPESIIPDFVQPILYINPAYYIIHLYHSLFVFPESFQPLFILVPLLLTLPLLALDLFLYKRLEKGLRDNL